MKPKEKDPIAVELGRRGGLKRKQKLSAKRRLEIAIKASKAAKKARKGGNRGR